MDEWYKIVIHGLNVSKFIKFRHSNKLEHILKDNLSLIKHLLSYSFLLQY